MSERLPASSQNPETSSESVYDDMSKSMLDAVKQATMDVGSRYDNGETELPAGELRGALVAALNDNGYDKNAWKMMHEMQPVEMEAFYKGAFEEADRRKTAELESIVAAYDNNDTFGDRRTALSDIMSADGDKAGWRKIYDMNNLDLKSFVNDARKELAAASTTEESEEEISEPAGKISMKHAAREAAVAAKEATESVGDVDESADKPDMSEFHDRMRRPKSESDLTKSQKRNARRKRGLAAAAANGDKSAEQQTDTSNDSEAKANTDIADTSEKDNSTSSKEVIDGEVIDDTTSETPKEKPSVDRPESSVAPDPESDKSEENTGERIDASRRTFNPDPSSRPIRGELDQSWRTIDRTTHVLPNDTGERSNDGELNEPDQSWMDSINRDRHVLRDNHDESQDTDDDIESENYEYQDEQEKRFKKVRSAIGNMRRRFAEFRGRKSSRGETVVTDGEYEKSEEKSDKKRKLAIGAAAVVGVIISGALIKYGYDHGAFSGMFGGGSTPDTPDTGTPWVGPNDGGLDPNIVPPADAPVQPPVEAPAPNANFLTDFNVANGQGGTEFLADNNIDPSKWFGFENDALARFPDELYRMNDGHVGLQNPGDMTSDLQQYIASKR